MFEMPNLNQLESRYAMNNLEMNPIMNFASKAIDYFVQACGEKNQIIFTHVEKRNSRFGISLNLAPFTFSNPNKEAAWSTNYM